ncbi:MAG: MarC family protein, partial [Candidatus Bathyarchaeia archaeon]
MLIDIVAEIVGMIPDLVKGVIALFIIIDPFGNVPIFVSLTERMGSEDRKKAFHTATLVGLVLLLFFAMAGREVLNFFGITIHSFMIAGGILLFIIAIRLLMLGGWQETA